MEETKIFYFLPLDPNRNYFPKLKIYETSFIRQTYQTCVPNLAYQPSFPYTPSAVEKLFYRAEVFYCEKKTNPSSRSIFFDLQLQKLSSSRYNIPHQDNDISSKMTEQLEWSSIVPNTATKDRGEIRRSDHLAHPQLGYMGCRTLYEAFRRGQALNPLGACLGFRAVSTNGLATPYIYSSYTEILARVDAFAAGLDTLILLTPTSDKIVLVREKNTQTLPC